MSYYSGYGSYVGNGDVSITISTPTKVKEVKIISNGIEAIKLVSMEGDVYFKNGVQANGITINTDNIEITDADLNQSGVEYYYLIWG